MLRPARLLGRLTSPRRRPCADRPARLRQSLPRPESPPARVCYHYSAQPPIAEAGFSPACVSKNEGCTQRKQRRKSRSLFSPFSPFSPVKFRAGRRGRNRLQPRQSREAGRQHLQPPRRRHRDWRADLSRRSQTEADAGPRQTRTARIHPDASGRRRRPGSQPIQRRNHRQLRAVGLKHPNKLHVLKPLGDAA